MSLIEVEGFFKTAAGCALCGRLNFRITRRLESALVLCRIVVVAYAFRLMTSFNASSFGPEFERWITQNHPIDLGPGTPPDASIVSELKALSVESAFADFQVTRQDMARACLSGVLLKFDLLDASHTLSQSIDNATGSFWHGIMHRREPDYGNAGYWFRRVGEHPILGALGKAAATLAAEAGIEQSRFDGSWEPDAFIELVSQCYQDGSPTEALCQQIQAREWELLFEYSFSNAIHS